jgi:hypothetical protein
MPTKSPLVYKCILDRITSNLALLQQLMHDGNYLRAASHASLVSVDLIALQELSED